MSQQFERTWTDAGTTLTGRHAARPTARQWALHLSLLILTAFTTTITGITFALTPEAITELGSASSAAVPRGLIGQLLLLPLSYLTGVLSLIGYAFAHPHVLAEGMIFSVSLLAILTAHELGHYLYCRYYGVDATMPFFIPQPPLLWPGTFGAFIKMKSPVPSRRALFDIGLAGPLAGFAVLVPIAFVGVLTSQPLNVTPGEGFMIFNDPLLLRLFARVLHVDLTQSGVNPYYLAAWFGLLVTSLNLIPVGQLDGGHATFAIFGARLHRQMGKVIFLAAIVVSLLGWFWYHIPSGFLYVALLTVMLRMGHPQPENLEPLGKGRVAIAIITLIVFALCFQPFPITFS